MLGYVCVCNVRYANNVYAIFIFVIFFLFFHLIDSIRRNKFDFCFFFSLSLAICFAVLALYLHFR